MKNIFKVVSIVLMTVFMFTAAACFGQSGGQAINSPEALKTYLDSQPANSPDKPIRVSMTINDPMLEKVADVIKKADKYVSLNITGNVLKTIEKIVFRNCKMLVSITIPKSVTYIGNSVFRGCASLASVTIPKSVTEILGDAFLDCTSLTSVTFQGTISLENLEYVDSFPGDLRDKYLAGGVGTYTREKGSNTWTKQ